MKELYHTDVLNIKPSAFKNLFIFSFLQNGNAGG